MIRPANLPLPFTGREFPVRALLRDALAMDTALFSISGSVVFADLAAARWFARDFEQYRASTGHPEPGVRAGEIAAMGVLHEALHHLLAVHRGTSAEHLPAAALEDLRDALGSDATEALLRRFCTAFPPSAVYRGEQSIDAYLDLRVDGLTGRERCIEEMILVRLANENPAHARYRELFDDAITDDQLQASAMGVIERRYASAPAALVHEAAADQTVLDLLRAPFRAKPDSLKEQLAYLREHYGAYVGDLLTAVLRSIDALQEEQRERAAPGADAAAEVYRYDDTEEQRFSPDTDWMPGVVMMAKSTLVWLHQLAERYETPIARLDEVPDEELDRLANAGVNALWLIGVWERSPASRRIKHLCGNPDAEASAYALYSYDVASEIGGWDALEQLRARCSERGIRLASDLVPNHTGIDSPWVHDHPDWYISATNPPFPAYTFSGENLSGRDDAGVYLEDHYYDRTDAAVVFRHHAPDGTERYIYHGNDGTSMPWNDTAQLNYLNPHVRETIIKTIIHVARAFPVIRFDAAMTLAKRHYRRLWFPEPGSGGDIASRADHGMTREQFDRAMPVEFWREVVERVAQEAPDTLLLAEAFWMMEGYFVRTLGMHRVYNSAFMHMLKREQNAEYRRIIRDTLAFDAEILKRFVNFMNNPDEETAVTQFGTGDKYFGVCTLLATMPGLPMFGHGQVEGLAEKYGMEFRRPYWDEQPDETLIARHEADIFPLLRRRRLFASAANFRLFDLLDDDGSVNENVFVYTNRTDGGPPTLVAYNNAYARASGSVHRAAPVGTPGGQTSDSLVDALGLSGDEGECLVLRSQRTGMWHVRRCSAVRNEGLRLELEGYESLVYWDIHERCDDGTGSLALLADRLAGAGVPDIDRALVALRSTPLQSAYASIVTRRLLDDLDAIMQGQRTLEPPTLDELRATYRSLLELARRQTDGKVGASVGAGLTALERHLATLASLPHAPGTRGETAGYRRAIGRYYTGIRGRKDRRELLAHLVLLVPLAETAGLAAVLEWGADAWIDDAPDPRTIRFALRHADWSTGDCSPGGLAARLVADQDLLLAIGVDAGSGWYDRAVMADLLWLLFATALVRLLSTSSLGGRSVRDRVERVLIAIEALEAVHEAAGGELARFIGAAADQANRQSTMAGETAKPEETSADSATSGSAPESKST